MPIGPRKRGRTRDPAKSQGRFPHNRYNVPVLIRVQDEAGSLISYATPKVISAVAFVLQQARTLTALNWREISEGETRNNLINKTHRWAWPSSGIKRISLRYSPREQHWFARIIGGTIPAGILAFPRNVDNPNGWVRPFEDPDADPPVVLPGTPFQDATPEPPPLNQRGVFQLNGTDLTYIPDQDFRLFESNNLVDWRSFQFPSESALGGRDFEILHFHNFSRYFPPHDDTGIDVASTIMEPFFYDKTGTVKVTGPTGSGSSLILGVALRFLDDDEKPTEYICAVGLFPTHDLEFFARDRDDILDPWRLIGSIPAAFYDDQLDNGVFSPFFFYSFNSVPLHFNRRGTRACKMLYSGRFATDGNAVPYLLEVVVNDEDITHSLVRQDTPLSATSRSFTFDDSEQTGPNIPPDCPDTATITTTIVTTTDRGDTSDSSQLACPIAVDYKIGSDDELGFITMDNVVSTEFSESGTSTSIDETFEVCLPDGTGTGREASVNGVLTAVERIDRSVTFHMDGGQAAFSIGPIVVNPAVFGNFSTSSIVRTITTTVTTEYTFPDLTNPSNVDSSIIQTVQLVRSANETKQASDQTVEIAAADIRYGSMIVKERSIVLENINHNTIPLTVPSEEFVGPVRQPTGATNAINPRGVFQSEPTFAVWGTRNVCVVRTTVRAQGIDDVHTATDPFFYALQLFSPTPNQRPHIVAGNIRFSGFTALPSPGEILRDDSEATPGLVGFARVSASSEIFLMPRTPPANTVHDRNGKYFYNIEVPSNDGMIHVTIGPVFQFAPDFDFTSFSSYQNLDPTIPVGMPLNEALGVQTTPENTTRPLFYALVAVQNEQIPEEPEP